MSIPKRGSRSIEVDGRRYRWRVRTRPTEQQRRGTTPLLLAVAPEASDKAALIVALHRPHPSNTAALTSIAVTPAEVASQIRVALRSGWDPDRPGPQFHMAAAAYGGPMVRTWPRGARPKSRAELELLALARRPEQFDVLRITERGSNLEINGVDLLDLVAAVERPLVTSEIAERNADGDNLDPIADDFTGQYMGFGAAHFRLPSRELLDEPHDTAGKGFVLAPDDPRRKKTTVLGCTCGIVDCWFLLVSITLFDDFVVWSEFEQFHRYWTYDLGPFVFDRKRYCAALV